MDFDSALDHWYNTLLSMPLFAVYKFILLFGVEEGLPPHGIVDFRYFSGQGVNKDECLPNIKFRKALLSMVSKLYVWWLASFLFLFALRFYSMKTRW